MDETQQEFRPRCDGIRVVVAGSPRLAISSYSQLLRAMGAVIESDLIRDFDGIRLVVGKRLPDVLVVLLPIEGLEEPLALLSLRKERPSLGFVLLNGDMWEPWAILELARASGVGLLEAEDDVSALGLAVHAAVSDAVAASSAIARTLFSGGTQDIQRPISSPLSRSQAMALQYLALGIHERDIAARMGLSLRTVQTHIARARERLFAVDRTHAVAIALASGMIPGVLSSIRIPPLQGPPSEPRTGPSFPASGRTTVEEPLC